MPVVAAQSPRARACGLLACGLALTDREGARRMLPPLDASPCR